MKSRCSIQFIHPWIRRLIVYIVHRQLSGHLNLHVLTMQAQRSGVDCGIFAMAAANALVFGVYQQIQQLFGKE